MANYFRRGVLLALAAWLIGQASVGYAQTSYTTNFDTGGLVDGQSILGTDWTGLADPTATTGYTNSAATVYSNAFTFAGFAYTNSVVFQGEISNMFASAILPNANNIASVQLLLQVTLSSSMPSNAICPDRQGGVCFSNNVATTNGDVYAWSTNGWLLATNVANPVLSITNNQWVLLTMVANYTGTTNVPTNTVFYQVYVNGTNLIPTAANCFSHKGGAFSNDNTGTYIQSSALFTTPGINGFYLAGSGAIDTLLATNGVPAVNTLASPLSSGIGIRAFQGAGGVYVEFQAEGTDGSGDVFLSVKDANGNIVFSDSQPAVSSGYYRFPTSGLVVGGAYTFIVRDGSGYKWTIPGVTVTSFAADMVQMLPGGMTMSFNTNPGQQYTVQWIQQLGGVWSNAIPTFTAVSTHTNVYVPFLDSTAPSGFLRILQQ